jgi:hypothetical protein
MAKQIRSRLKRSHDLGMTSHMDGYFTSSYFAKAKRKQNAKQKSSKYDSEIIANHMRNHTKSIWFRKEKHRAIFR